MNLSFGGPIPVTNLNEYLLAICLLAKKFILKENLSILIVTDVKPINAILSHVVSEHCCLITLKFFVSDEIGVVRMVKML